MDVEAILNQIRARVVSDDAGASNTMTQPNGSSTNGPAPASLKNDSLERVSAHLGVTRRAWNRLPPVFSNRSGSLARLELWIKKKCASLTRWFTWEQVNFNHAVNEALGEVVEILKADAHELAQLRAEAARLHAESVELSSQVDRHVVKLQSDLDGHAQELRNLNTSRADLGGRLDETVASLGRVSELLASLAEEARDGHSQLNHRIAERAAEMNRALAELSAELKEEQRVCFRQLSLEASESAILEDRARRELLARMERLEQALKSGQRE